MRLVPLRTSCPRIFDCRHGYFDSIDDNIRGGLLAGKVGTDGSIDYAPGSRWDPKASSIAGLLRRRYDPLLPIFQELKVVSVRMTVVFRCFV
jgi:hypothetical protein